MEARNWALPHPRRRTGKPLSVKQLGRDLDWKLKMAEATRESADRVLRDFKSSKLQKCPICQSTAFDPFLEVYGFLFVQCRECTHIFSQLLPDQEAMYSIYGGKDQPKLQHRVYLDPELFEIRAREIATPKVKHVTDFIGAPTANQNLWVDVGCSTGEIIAAAKNLGWSAQGFDTDPDEIAFANERGLNAECKLIDRSNAPMILGKARVVSFLNLLEHLSDPMGWFKVFSDHIPSGSYAVIEVPRYPSLSALAMFAFPELIHRYLNPPLHIHLYSEISLNQLLESGGFEIQDIWTFGQDYEEILNSMSAHTKTPVPRALLEALAAASPEGQRATDTSNLSDVMLVTARKL
jgi:SAM-dependent methyltransferase